MEINKSKEFFNIMLAKRYPYTIAIKRVQIDGLESWLRYLQTKGWWDGRIEHEFVNWFNYYNKKYPFTKGDLSEFKKTIRANHSAATARSDNNAAGGNKPNRINRKA